MFDNNDLPELTVSKVPAHTMFAFPGLAGTAKELPPNLEDLLRLLTYLSDKAVWEYEAARTAMLQYTHGGAKGFVLPTTISFNIDNCIVTLHRLVRVFAKCVGGASHLVLSSTEKRIVGTYHDRLDGLRDALQHTEEHVLRDPQGKRLMPERTPVYPRLMPKQGLISVGGNTIKSFELRDMVQRCHAIALELSTQIKRFEGVEHKPITNDELRKK